MRSPSKAALACVVFLGAWAAHSAWALSSDRNQPMHIEADQVSIDDQKEVSVYRGHVIVTQGSLRITSDTLTVYSKQQQIDHMVAIGNPATYRQRPDHKDQDVQAHARRMEYYARQDRVVLIDDAHLLQGGNTFVSKRIDYNLRTDQVQAGAKGGGDRVRIVIQPPPPKSGKTAPKK